MSSTIRPSHQSTQHDVGDSRAGPIGRKVSELFAENIFSLNMLKDHLSESAYDKMRGVVLIHKQFRPDTLASR